MTGEKKCAELIYDGWAFRGRACQLSPTLFEDGKWWCGKHAPSKLAARKEQQEAETQRRRMEEEEALWKREAIKRAERAVVVAAVAWQNAVTDMNTAAERRLDEAVEALLRQEGRL